MTEVLKIISKIVDKYMMTSIISVVMASIVYLFIPKDNIFNEEYGTIFTFILISLAILLLVEGFKVLFRIVLKVINRRTYDIEDKESFQSLLGDFWCEVDKLSVNDRKLLLTFIETNNAPLEVKGDIFYSSVCLLNSDWVNKTVNNSVGKNEESKVISKPTFNDIKAIYDNSNNTTYYKLKENVFQLLKYSYVNHGKISHFE